MSKLFNDEQKLHQPLQWRQRGVFLTTLGDLLLDMDWRSLEMCVVNNNAVDTIQNKPN